MPLQSISDLMSLLGMAAPPPRPAPTASIPGLLIPGNIDYTKRPVVRNKDGSISTVRSMSFERNGKEILIPTVHPNGYIMSDAEAIRHYDKTGEHMGIFASPDAATAYAQQVHNAYATGQIPGYPAVQY